MSLPSYADHPSLGQCPYQVTLITNHWDTALPRYADHPSLGQCPYQVTLITFHWDTVPTKLH